MSVREICQKNPILLDHKIENWVQNEMVHDHKIESWAQNKTDGRSQHWDIMLDLDFQVQRYDVPHVMALKDGLLSSHCGLALDGTVLTQRRRLRNAKQLGISKIPTPSLYEEILLLLILVNCCTALKRRGNAGNWRQLVCCAVTP